MKSCPAFPQTRQAVLFSSVQPRNRRKSLPGSRTPNSSTAIGISQVICRLMSSMSFRYAPRSRGRTGSHGQSTPQSKHRHFGRSGRCSCFTARIPSRPAPVAASATGRTSRRRPRLHAGLGTAPVLHTRRRRRVGHGRVRQFRPVRSQGVLARRRQDTSCSRPLLRLSRQRVRPAPWAPTALDLETEQPGEEAEQGYAKDPCHFDTSFAFEGPKWPGACGAPGPDKAVSAHSLVERPPVSWGKPSGSVHPNYWASRHPKGVRERCAVYQCIRRPGYPPPYRLDALRTHGTMSRDLESAPAGTRSQSGPCRPDPRRRVPVA
jgi:hypothetical protein